MEEKEKVKSNLRFQKRLAAEVAGVGIDRIKIPPEFAREVSEAITREEIRILIHKGKIIVEDEKGQSRVRARILHEKRKKGRRRGPGKRKGKKTARMDPKRIWINKVRKMRIFLRYLRDKEIITRRDYRKLRSMVKGGFFRSLNHLKIYLEKNYGLSF